MTDITADRRLRTIRYRGYLTVCRVIGTLAVIALLSRGPWASEVWNDSVTTAFWWILIPTAVLEFWLRRQARE
jgi:hypothetical protein